MRIETLRRGRVFDPGTRRWYKDGYAPFQLPASIEATCLRCGRDTLTITQRGAFCPCTSTKGTP